ncbi:MAG: T9SS type A sorting domain-containing protein [Bacteroidia bacterium]|nr:T9SS type A sorting domain-containing protein [Bacteroidia bacterium]
MKKKVLIFPFIIVVLVGYLVLRSDKPQIDPEIESLRVVHQKALENSPYKDTKNLSKDERKKLGIPPNGYNERMWELTMDPRLGRPAPERLELIQKQLNEERANARGVGGDSNNPWIDRGPNNIGGRTRGLMFDPNDVTNTRVFGGGVSGGLWVNNDITDPNSSWALVPGIGANISVNVIISDPNNSNIFYIGTGESYTSGAVIGRGIWKSIDGGVNWTNIWGGYTGTSSGNQIVDGVFYINDLVARDMGTTTELYAAVAGAFYGPSSPSQWHGLNQQNVYKSTNNGTSWTSLGILESGIPINPNDLEIDPFTNDVWFTTTSNSFSGSLGGTIYSYNGTTPTLVNSITNAKRVEIEPSSSTSGTFWAAASIETAPGTYTVTLYTTTNSFGALATIGEPNDADPNIPISDFTRGQSWYDLVIESDASGNLIAGGIDLHRSTNNGTNWGQLSEWYNIGGLTASYVHADQHSAVQRPGSPNSYIFGTDGGVFYCADITTAVGSSSAIQARNKDFNTVQFYYGAFDTSINGLADDLIGGTQDNGTPAVYDAVAGANGFTDLTGGDGGYTDIDDNGLYIVTAYPGNMHYVIIPPSTFYQISSGTGGNFINEAELDNNLDILYSNSSTGSASIERISNFQSGAGSVTRTTLTNALLNSSPSAMKVSPYTTASTKLFVGLTNGTLLRVDNADTTPSWNNITGPSFAGSISDVELGQTDQDIFVTMFNYGITSLWYSNDGGATWFNKEGNLPDLPIRCVLQNPLRPQEVILGTELGVWATADILLAGAGSPNWIQTYNGMSDVTVVDLDLRTADNAILASTHGRGLFTSQFTSVTLSVEEEGFVDNTLSIVPTVSDGAFTLISQRSLGNINFTIYDLSGKEVYRSDFNMNSNRKRFDLNLNAGMYIVRIQSDNSSVSKRLIIK